MEKVTFINRTTKSEGSIKLRFRLRDGRSVDLYYKSDIEASLKDLSKFTPEGNLRSKSTVYSRFLRQSGKKEFEGIRRDFPKARNIQESVGKSDATLSWEVPILQMLKQRQFSGLMPFLKALFNRQKYCRHFCHAELGDAYLE